MLNGAARQIAWRPQGYRAPRSTLQWRNTFRAAACQILGAAVWARIARRRRGVRKRSRYPRQRIARCIPAGGSPYRYSVTPANRNARSGSMPSIPANVPVARARAAMSIAPNLPNVNDMGRSNFSDNSVSTNAAIPSTATLNCRNASRIAEPSPVTNAGLIPSDARHNRDAPDVDDHPL